ncbi:MAG: nucleoside triphosphate pyrophosphohydrolase [Steroidobacteraceae bacterium]
MEQLLAVMRRLRDPQGGCAWDLEQTMRSIVPHTLEEAYEVADAIERDDPAAVRDELGDLLYQVVFLARIAEESGQFDFDEVARAIANKLVRRHPHVFGSQQALTADEQTLAWEGFKQNERAEAGERGTLDGVARTLPALTRAVKLGKRAARVHFDWPDASHMRAKLDEELAEFEETLRERQSVERQSEELGDLLFVVANWARHLKLDPEASLRAANAKFESRFRYMESIARDRGLVLEQLDLDTWEALWQEAKTAEKAAKSA